MKFRGSFEELKSIVERLGFEIESAGPRGTTKQIRTKDGGIVNFYQTTGTLLFQGNEHARENLEKAISGYGSQPSSLIEGSGGEEIHSQTLQTCQPSKSHFNTRVLVVVGFHTANRKKFERILRRLRLDLAEQQASSGATLKNREGRHHRKRRSSISQIRQKRSI